MERAGLPLQAWGFSNTFIEQQFQSEGRLDQHSVSKTLGFTWDRVKDTLSVQQVNLSSFCSESASHRDVLRGVATLYDPLGFYAPITTKGRILLQDLHKEGVQLDQTLSQKQREQWIEIANSITGAVDQQIMCLPRGFFQFISEIRELHIFADASRRAYGAVAYLVHEDKVAFVMSKPKINPKKEQTKEGERELSIPEAELMAAYIGTLIAETIVTALEPLGIHLDIFLWSDSQITHFWISKSEGHPRPFITNRVKKITEFTHRRKATWKFVPSEHNPADILSRGASLKEFKASILWKSGPTWLTTKTEWPTWSVDQFKTCQILHMAQVGHKQSQSLSQPTIDIFSIIDPSRYRWSMLVRTTAVILRVCDNWKKRDPSQLTWNRLPLSTPELLEVELLWIRAFQRNHLVEELRYLKTKKKCWRPSLVFQLDLFLDSTDIVRCGGRFGNANMTYSAKHPILIPKNSVLAKLLITDTHERIFHLGIDATIVHMQQRYWITSFRQQVGPIVRNCRKCRRESGPAYRLPDPAPLPAPRVRDAYPFATMGIDYTGAINVKVNGSAELSPVYILLMTCGFSRAIHLEWWRTCPLNLS